MATPEELEAQVKEQQQKIDDLSKAGGLTKEQTDRLAHLEGENKDLITSRDKAKQEKRDLEEKALRLWRDGLEKNKAKIKASSQQP